MLLTFYIECLTEYSCCLHLQQFQNPALENLAAPAAFSPAASPAPSAAPSAAAVAASTAAAVDVEAPIPTANIPNRPKSLAEACQLAIAEQHTRLAASIAKSEAILAQSSESSELSSVESDDEDDE
jgi:hypothetical protein